MNGDLISRQAAIRWVKTECNPYGKPTLDFESGEKVIEHLERMPSAQPERKTGQWERVPNVVNGIDFRCSACHRYRFHNGEMVQKYNYCPNCGADMRGSANA